MGPLERVGHGFLVDVVAQDPNFALLVVRVLHGLQLLGYYVSEIGALNQVVHIWRYDSLADLERKRTARDADPDWKKFLAETEGYVLMQEDKVMRPTSFSPKV